MKTKRFNSAGTLIAAFMALAFTGCGDSGGGDGSSPGSRGQNHYH
jgi:hypothetical protein